MKSVLRAPVPEYWMLIMSAWSAQTFLKRFSKWAWFSILTLSPSTPSLNTKDGLMVSTEYQQETPHSPNQNWLEIESCQHTLDHVGSVQAVDTVGSEQSTLRRISVVVYSAVWCNCQPVWLAQTLHWRPGSSWTAPGTETTDPSVYSVGPTSSSCIRSGNQKARRKCSDPSSSARRSSAVAPTSLLPLSGLSDWWWPAGRTDVFVPGNACRSSLYVWPLASAPGWEEVCISGPVSETEISDQGLVLILTCCHSNGMLPLVWTKLAVIPLNSTICSVST